MAFDGPTLGARIAAKLTKSKVALGDLIRRLIEARSSRIAREREFYRNLNAYCRANNLPPVCEDDWKTGAYATKNEDRSPTSPKEMCHGQS